MKVFVTLLLVSSAAILINADKYTTKYDNVDVDTIIKSDRLLLNYVKCLLNTGKCTTDAAELKRVLPDALQTDCSKCSEVQKKGSKKIIRHLIDNKSEWYSDLEAIYDKDGTYKAKYEKEIKDSKN
ncbi:unnamed protein product [Phyllotreta striolata]|uniref:Uncharacterized protein n=1 Tax=Phyllotreta striolata TaxID=444603 RepID=A0A9N9TQ58_PHYSR|nr:unnamed protein product [Phyllotreta striolata]